MNELDIFRAGWEAAEELQDHEWGPSPPQTPEAAYRQWKNTCREGHIIRVKGCKACASMVPEPGERTKP